MFSVPFVLPSVLAPPFDQSANVACLSVACLLYQQFGRSVSSLVGQLVVRSMDQSYAQSLVALQPSGRSIRGRVG